MQDAKGTEMQLAETSRTIIVAPNRSYAVPLAERRHLSARTWTQPEHLVESALSSLAVAHRLVERIYLVPRGDG